MTTFAPQNSYTYMISKIRLSLTLPLFLLAIHSTYAQLEAHLIDGEGWAKGDLVEIGINSLGVYGANTDNKPSSFHDNREQDGNNIFGFIANPLNDGWVDYDGDFFTPGAPEEGFSIEIDNTNYSNNNFENLFQIPGSVKNVNVLSSDCFDDTAQIFWEGNAGGLNIKRYYSVTKDGLFIQMTTSIKNITTQDKANVYFMHNVDPDNNITLSGYYETDMQLISQASSTSDNLSLVTAYQAPLGTPQDMDGAYVSLFSRDELARVSYGGFNNRNAQAAWNGTGIHINVEGSTTNNVDEAISISFNLGTLAPNETRKFTYYYILKEIDETFTPIIVNVFQENPSTCNGADGKIVLSGLISGDQYDISYSDDSTPIPEQTYTADENGEISLDNLDSGTYSDLTLSFVGCSTAIETTFELIDPTPPDYYFTKQDLTNCANLNGRVTIHNLTPYTNYLVSYELNGELIAPSEFTANFNGEIIFSNLGGSIYSNFTLEQYGCITSSTEIIEITEPEKPTSFPIPEQFYCDEDYDYVTSIDLTPTESFIIGTDTPSDFIITYHKSEQSAIDGINLNATAYTTLGMSSFTLYAKKTNHSNLCYSYIPFTVNINLPPTFDFEDGAICVNNDDTVNFDYDLPRLTTGLSNTHHNFKWYFEGNLIVGENLNELIANDFGLYSVSATTIETGCSITKYATVHPSGPPKILEVDIISIPFSDNHTVTINAFGFGDYDYAIDNEQYQSSATFTHISPGFHEFHIRDTNGCGRVTVEKMLIDYMHFFTPNNDGFKDYWQIIGARHLRNPKIYIYDRFGKLLTQLKPNSRGWDGTFHGKALPVSDYWFKVIFLDDDNNQREFSSHFTLKK